MTGVRRGAAREPASPTRRTTRRPACAQPRARDSPGGSPRARAARRSAAVPATRAARRRMRRATATSGMAPVVRWIGGRLAQAWLDTGGAPAPPELEPAPEPTLAAPSPELERRPRPNGRRTAAQPSSEIRRLILPISSTKRCRTGAPGRGSRPSTSGSDRPRTRPPRRGGRSRTSRFPQACSPARSTVNSWLQAGQVTAAWPCALLVDPPVQVLEEREVGREQALDDAGVDLRSASRAG